MSPCLNHASRSFATKPENVSEEYHTPDEPGALQEYVDKTADTALKVNLPGFLL